MRTPSQIPSLLAGMLLLAACSGPARNPVVKQPAPLAAMEAPVAAPTEPPPSEPAPKLAEPAREARADDVATADLAGRAFELTAHGDPLGALRLLERGLAAELQAGHWRDARAVAGAVVAAWLYSDLVERFDRWKEVVQTFPSAPPSTTPPELASAIEYVRANALRALGRHDDARAITRASGRIGDWRVIGPFDNERGGGFDAPHPPEQSIDLAQSVRGKERDVAWRANPGAEHPLGRVVVGELFRPNRQVAAYLATAIESPSEQDALLALGSSCAVKVFLNGHEVLARKVRRPFHPDQDRAVLPLAVGTNQLLVKLAIEDWPDWVFEARLSDLDGRPLEDVRVDSAAVGAPELAWREPRAQPAKCSREVFAALESDAAAARWRTLYELLVHPDDVASESDRAAAETARALAPDDATSLYLVALATAPEVGTSRIERQVNPHLFALREVLERDPRHTAALLDLAAFYMDDDPIPTRADEYTARALESAPNALSALTLRARALESRGRGAEARILTRRAEEVPLASALPSAALPRAQRATIQGDPDAGLQLLEQHLEERFLLGAPFDRALAAYVDRGQLERAAAALEHMLEGAPYSTESMLKGARMFELSGDLPAARALALRALAVAPEEKAVLLMLARLDVRAADLASADARLAEVLRIDPGYDKARRQRALLQENVQDQFEAPYRRDGVEIVRAAPPPEAGANDPIAVLDRTSVFRVHPDGTEAHYEHLILRAQNLGGVQALDSYSIGYPAAATLLVHNVRVIHPDGSTERAPAPERGDRASGGWRVRQFDLPPLSPGDAVEIEYRIDENEPDVFGEYFGLRYSFYPDGPDPLAPTARAELVVIAPEDLPLYTTERNAQKLEQSQETGNGLSVRRWVARDLVRPSLEAAMPKRSEFAPGVDVTTYASWDAFARWWWHFIEKEFVTTPEMKAKVQELTAGLTTEHDKVQAIARFVGQEIRYNAWPFGTHGYQPFSAATIFERRFGDCKDKSILLRQMLAEIGVEAIPVLIDAEFARALEPLDAAMVEHFNHCIAYLPETAERPGYYLDATADRNPIDYLRADDQGARVLHVDANGGTLHDIPYAQPSTNALVREYEVTLDAGGDGEVKLSDASNGIFGVQNRYRFGGEQGDLKKRLAESLGEAFGQVEVREIETSKLEDIGAPATLTARFSAKGLWTREQGGASLRLAFDPIGIESVAVETPEERTFDVVLDRPFAVRTRVTYRLPAGARVLALPPKAQVHADGLVDYTIDVREENGAVVVEREFDLRERRVSRSRYADFRNALQEIQRAEERTIRVEAPASPASDRSGGER